MARYGGLGQKKWHQPRPSAEVYKMALAVEVASRSNCLKSHVGAILLLGDRIRAVGYNGTIEGYPNCFDGGCPRCRDITIKRGEQLDRCVCVHAEENALISAARYGISVKGTECFVTHKPCLGCTKLLIQAHVKSVVYLQRYEYPDTNDLNKNRDALRKNSARQTQFQRFRDPSAADAVHLWLKRLDKMKTDALGYASAKGVLKKK